MRQVACNATLEGIGQLNGCRYVLHDRDAKFCLRWRLDQSSAIDRFLLGSGDHPCTSNVHPLPPRSAPVFLLWLSPRIDLAPVHAHERWSHCAPGWSIYLTAGWSKLRSAIVLCQKRSNLGCAEVVADTSRPLLPKSRGMSYSDTTVASHEYFDQTRCAWGGAVRARLDLGGINLSRAEFFGLRGFFGAEIFLRGGAGFSSPAQFWER